MESLMKSDIFFFVTTICVVAVSAFVVAAVYYLIKILIDLRQVSKGVKEESRLIIEDAKEIRESFKNNGGLLRALISFILSKKTKNKKKK